MEMQESFVESMTDGRGGLDQDDNERNSANEAGHDEIAVGYGGSDSRPTSCRPISMGYSGTRKGVYTCFDLGNHPAQGMTDGFKDYQSSQPTVHHVERVEGDVEQGNEWIVAAGHQDHWDEVRN